VIAAKKASTDGDSGERTANEKEKQGNNSERTNFGFEVVKKGGGGRACVQRLIVGVDVRVDSGREPELEKAREGERSVTS
jgi:hypothetical protein